MARIVHGWAALTAGCTLAAIALAPGFNAQASGVSVFYELPEQVTLHEPVSLVIVATNMSAETVTIDLGKNKVGHTQVTVTLPSGNRFSIDPRRPLRADEGWVAGVVTLRPQETVRTELVLNDWFGFATTGLHRLLVQFIGTVDAETGSVAVERRTDMMLDVLPRNEAKLRAVADRLVRQIQSPYSEPAVLAARKLFHLNDSVAVPFLIQVIDQKKGTWVDPIMISALERIGTEDARAALARATTNQDPITARAASAALERLEQRGGQAGR